MDFISSLANKAKALALNISELELKVLEATNEDPWGPAGSEMAEFARAAEDSMNYDLIMNTLSERLTQRGENWRLCYKALLALDYLAKHGPMRVVEELTRSISSLERLRDCFEYIDPAGRDQGVNIRHRAGELISLVMSPDRIRIEREKASKNAGKYRGVSANEMRDIDSSRSSGYGSSGFGSNNSGYGNSSNGSYGVSSGGFSSSSNSSNSSNSNSNSNNNNTFATSNNRHSFPNQSLHNKPAVRLQSAYKSGSPSSNNVTQSTATAAAASPSALGRAISATSSSSYGNRGEFSNDEDPFEATRRRIERLKAEGGAIPDSSDPNGSDLSHSYDNNAGGGVGAPPIRLMGQAETEKKGPKKLSDVKVNPVLAAAFANYPSVSSSSSNAGSSANKAGLARPLAPPPRANNSSLPPPPSPSSSLSSSIAAAGNEALLSIDLVMNTDRPSYSSSSVAVTAPEVSEENAMASSNTGVGASTPSSAVMAKDPFGDFFSMEVPVSSGDTRNSNATRSIMGENKSEDAEDRWDAFGVTLTGVPTSAATTTTTTVAVATAVNKNATTTRPPIDLSDLLGNAPTSTNNTHSITMNQMMQSVPPVSTFFPTPVAVVPPLSTGLPLSLQDFSTPVAAIASSISAASAAFSGTEKVAGGAEYERHPTTLFSTSLIGLAPEIESKNIKADPKLFADLGKDFGIPPSNVGGQPMLPSIEGGSKNIMNETIATINAVKDTFDFANFPVISPTTSILNPLSSVNNNNKNIDLFGNFTNDNNSNNNNINNMNRATISTPVSVTSSDSFLLPLKPSNNVKVDNNSSLISAVPSYIKNIPSFPLATPQGLKFSIPPPPTASNRLQHSTSSSAASSALSFDWNPGFGTVPSATSDPQGGLAMNGQALAAVKPKDPFEDLL